MTLKDIQTNPSEALVYLDRYVNDGSPSGFTEINRTSDETDPFGSNKTFHLYYIEIPEEKIYTFGSLKGEQMAIKKKFYVHPDMINHVDLKGYTILIDTSFEVSPTSSCRTVRIINGKSNDFIKLHYDGIIGRINRKLNSFRAMSGVEISNTISTALIQQNINSPLSIYKEPFCNLFLNTDIQDKYEYWGMVWRESKPFGNNAQKVVYTIPLFSLWSKDRLSTGIKETLASQLFAHWGTQAQEYFLHKILIPILDSYFELIVKLGLQNEYNSQNILIGFDKEWTPVSIIFRDMMGIEKDFDIRKSLGLSNDFKSFPYKIIQSSDNLYSIRHSFSFDFKVCNYVIEPLIEIAVKCKLSNKSELVDILKVRTKYWLNLLPKDYFPVNKWYSHEKVLLTGKREYIEHSKPILRD